MFNSADYGETLANPFNNITTKAPRVLKSDDVLVQYVKPAVTAFQRLRKTHTAVTGSQAEFVLSSRLLKLRMHGAISMQKFNPVHIFIRAVAAGINAKIKYGGVNNILSDLVHDVDAVGKFDVFTIELNDSVVLANGLYVDKYGGLDKAKEWAARGRAFPYRLVQGKVIQAVSAMIFVADGPWKSESIKRLREGGWIVCRPGEFADVLKDALTGGDQCKAKGNR